MQDAAYESLLKARRQQIHGRLLVALLGEADAAPEILAHHAEKAGLTEKAIEYWQQAGESGLARSANQEAVAQLSSAIRLIASLGDAPGRKEKELGLQVALGQALIATEGYSAQETERAFDRALELSGQLGSTPLRMPALYGRWVVPYVRSAPTRAYADEFYMAAKAQADVGSQVVGLRMRALEESHSGNFPAALKLLEEALRLYKPDQHKGLGLKFGHDPRAASLIYKRWLLWLMGFADRADEAGQEALQWAEEVGHANTLGIVRCWGLVLPEVLQRRPAQVEQQARLAIALSDEQRMPL